MWQLSVLLFLVLKYLLLSSSDVSVCIKHQYHQHWQQDAFLMSDILKRFWQFFTTWKMSKYGVFWSVFSCIQSEYRKIRTRKNSVLRHFSRTGCISICNTLETILELKITQPNNKTGFVVLVTQIVLWFYTFFIRYEGNVGQTCAIIFACCISFVDGPFP